MSIGPPTFRRRTACGLRTGVIIPLGPKSLRDSSGLPEGYNGPGQPSPPIWPCTTRGLPCLERCRPSGGLLPHRFTLALHSLPVKDEPKVFLRLVIEAFAVRLRLPQAAPAVYFLWHCPWPSPRRPDPLALPGALPFSPTIVRHRTAVSGLSSRPSIVRCRPSDHPTCPPVPLYAARRPPSTRDLVMKWCEQVPTGQGQIMVA